MPNSRHTNGRASVDETSLQMWIWRSEYASVSTSLPPRSLNDRMPHRPTIWLEPSPDTVASKFEPARCMTRVGRHVPDVPGGYRGEKGMLRRGGGC